MTPALGQQPATSATPPTPAVRMAWPGWLGALLLILATAIAYIPAMRAGFIWDDDSYLYLTDNNIIVRNDGLKRIWTTTSTPQWYPMVFTTFWAEYRLWGHTPNPELGKNEVQRKADPPDPERDEKPAWFNPTGYHIVNVLLHAFTAVLVWRILLRLKVPGAWLAAAIFALHPVHVESVAWITERKNVLSGFFYMVSLLSFLWFAERKWLGVGGSLAAYLLAIVAFVAALLSKSVTCSLPVAAILAAWLIKDRMRWPAVVIGVMPFFALGLAMASLTSWYEFHKMEEGYWEPMPIGKAFRLAAVSVVDKQERERARARSDYDLTALERTIIASRSLLFYAQKLIVPHPQAFFYPLWKDPSVRRAPDGSRLPRDPSKPSVLDPSNAVNLWPIAAVLAAGVVVIGLSVIYGRGIFIACFFFAMTLTPALGFFDTYPMRYSFVADHFQYLASLGPICLIAAGLALLFRPKPGGGVAVPALNGATAVGGVLAIILLIALGGKTFARCRVYRNEETLWTDTIYRTPTAWGARINLGMLYARRAQQLEKAGKKDEARADYDRAEEQFRAIIDGGAGWQEAPSNLGNIYAMRRDFATAEKLFRLAVKYEPRLANLWIRLAKTLTNQKKFNEALAVYEEAAKVDPAYYVWRQEWPRLFQEWADVLEKTGQADKAREKLAQADEMRKTLPARKPTATTPTTATAAGSTPPGTAIDLGGAKNPQERRKAYLNVVDAAIARRDYVGAMGAIQAGIGEFPTSAGLWTKYTLLLAASPIDSQRNAKTAVELAEKLRASLAANNILDAPAMEVIAAAYAEAGRFEDAVKAAQEGTRLSTRGSPGVAGRLQTQIKMYEISRPYRLPPPLAAGETVPPPPPTTRPTVPQTQRVASQTRPAPAPWPARQVPNPATKPAGT